MRKFAFFFSCLFLLLIGCSKGGGTNPDPDPKPDPDTETGETYTKLRVDVNIDWSSVTKSVGGATLIFYPRNGSSVSEPIYLLTNSSNDYIELQLGVYDVVLFNETMDSFKQISFTGKDSYKMFSAYWNVENGVVEDSQEMLYVDRAVDLVINQSMIDNQKALTLNFVPSAVATLMSFDFNVEQLNNVSEKNSSYMNLTGLSSGYSFFTGMPTGESVSHKTTLSDREYTTNGNGKMKSSFYVFGKAVDITKAATPSNQLSLQFSLKNNETKVTTPIDVTKVVEKLVVAPNEVVQPNESLTSQSEEQSQPPKADAEKAPEVKLEVGGVPESGVVGDIDGDGEADLSSDVNDELVVPQVPNYEADGGFSTTTDKWGESIIIPIL